MTIADRLAALRPLLSTLPYRLVLDELVAEVRALEDAAAVQPE